jgi:hypothetical protein
MIVPVAVNQSGGNSGLEDLAWHAASLCVLVLDPAGRILQANEAARRALDPLPEGGLLWDLLPDSSATVLRIQMRDAHTAPVRRVLLNFSNAAGGAITLSCSVSWNGEWYVLLGEMFVERDQRIRQELLDLTRELVASNRERTRVSAELERTLADLRNSHWHIQRIQEFLPACCQCNKVRMVQGEEGAVWKSLSAFLAENGLLMSHGYCPDCEAEALAAVDADLPDPVR